MERLHLLEPPEAGASPVDLGEAMEFMVANVGEDESQVIRLLKTATALFEEETGRQVLTATWRLFLPRFPVGREAVSIPKPPLQEVVQVRYVDSAGNLQTWSADEWEELAPAGPFARTGSLFPAAGHVYPSSRWAPDAVQVDFKAGWGGPEDVPEAVQDTIMALALGLFEDREPQLVGTNRMANRSFDRLLARHRLPVMA